MVLGINGFSRINVANKYMPRKGYKTHSKYEQEDHLADIQGTLPELASTFRSVQRWYEHVFTHLGWMILAAGKGNPGKIDNYINGIEHLLATIDHLMKEYENDDRLHDLNVMRMNTEFLLDFVENL